MNIYSTTQMEFITDSNAKFIQHTLRKYRDDELLIIRAQVNTSGDTWEELKLRRTRSISFSISKKHAGDTLKHKDFTLLVLGKYRLYVFVPYKKELKVCHNIPLIEVERIEHLSPSQFRFKTGKLDLRFLGVEDEVSEFLVELYTTTVLAFPGLLNKIELHFYKENQANTVKQQVEEQFYSLKCGGFVKSYETMCSYLEIEPRFEFCWDVDNLYHFNDITDFRLSDFKALKLQYLDYKAIFHSFHYNLYFKSLTIDFRLDKDLLHLIPPIFAFNSSLNSLTLKSCGLTKDLCSAFRRSFEQNNKIQLEFIDFSDNFIEEKGLVEILKYVETCKIKLSHLDVSNCNISEKGMFILAGKLYDYKDKITLSCLNLAGNRLDPNSTKAFSLIFNSIFNLNLSGTNPDFSLLGKCENLTELDISHCNKTLKDLSFLSSFFKLKKLNLRNCNINAEMLIPVFSHLKIEEIDLSDNAQTFGDQGVIDLVEILKGKSELKILKLNRNFDSKVKFHQRKKSVESLIEICKFSCQYRGTKVVRVGLESLEISGTSKFCLKESILPFIYSLLTNQTLTKLDITGNHVGDALGVAMAKVMQTNAFLEEIYMDDNQVTDFAPIRNALHRNRSLKFFQNPTLDLMFCLKLDKSCKNSTVAIVNEIQQLVYKNCLHPVGIMTPPGAMTPVEERVRMTEIKKRNSTKFVIDVGRASSIFVTSTETSPVFPPPKLVSRDSIEEDTILSQEKISIAFEKAVDSPMNKRHLGDRSMSLMELHSTRSKAEVYRYDANFVQ